MWDAAENALWVEVILEGTAGLGSQTRSEFLLDRARESPPPSSRGGGGDTSPAPSHAAWVSSWAPALRSLPASVLRFPRLLGLWTSWLS